MTAHPHNDDPKRDTSDNDNTFDITTGDGQHDQTSRSSQQENNGGRQSSNTMNSTPDNINDHDAGHHDDAGIEMDFEAQLTAYALGELDEADAKRIEQTLANGHADDKNSDHALRAATGAEHVRRVQELGVLLGDVLVREDAPQLTELQRQRISAAGAAAEGDAQTDGSQEGHFDDSASPVLFSFRKFALVGGGLAAAAAITLTATSGLWWPGGGADMVARHESGATAGDGRQYQYLPEAPADSDPSAMMRSSLAVRGGEVGNASPEALVNDLIRESSRSRAQFGQKAESIDADGAPERAMSARRKVVRDLASNAQDIGSIMDGAMAGAGGGGGDAGATELSTITADARRAQSRGAEAERSLSDEARARGRRAGQEAKAVEKSRTRSATPPPPTNSAKAVAADESNKGLTSTSGNLKNAKEQQADAPPTEGGRVDDLDLESDAPHDQMQDRLLAQLEQANREQYARIWDNPFIRPTGESALSTFSIDVDTAAYANVRRYITSGELPPADAVRIEEMINYFNYDYKVPVASEAHPFSVDVAAMPAPWKQDHRLVRIALKGREVAPDNRPATNLVFLLDVSGSMDQPNKLPLLKQSFKMLVDRLNGDDRVAIVVYAGASGVVLPSTYCYEKQTILSALDNLRAGGSTNGGAGIELAYKIATDNFIKEGVNRVILATDGDFNVGVSSDANLVRLIEQKRKTGVYLSVLGFGTGNFQDAKMEQLSNHGNGSFAYIDSEREAKKALVEQISGTLVTIAKDVKIQVEFNPAHVAAYRLIGYENRLLAAEDFNDDSKDAGEIGAGLTVTALYEIVPVGVEIDLPSVDELKYQSTAGQAESQVAAADEATDDVAQDAARDANADAAAATIADQLLTVKLRYKQPDAPEGGQSVKVEHVFVDPGQSIVQASADFRFAAAVAGCGMVLRGSPHRGDATLHSMIDLAVTGLPEGGVDKSRGGYRQEFIDLMNDAAALLYNHQQR